MYHSQDVPNRAGQHGVFDANEQAEVLAVIDEAYLQAQSGKKTRTQEERGRSVHTVDLGRRIGFVGGQSGAKRNHPETRHVRLVLEKERVITAFPVRP